MFRGTHKLALLTHMLGKTTAERLLAFCAEIIIKMIIYFVCRALTVIQRYSYI